MYAFRKDITSDNNSYASDGQNLKEKLCISGWIIGCLQSEESKLYQSNPIFYWTRLCLKIYIFLICIFVAHVFSQDYTWGDLATGYINQVQ